MRLSDTAYNILKWVGLIALPAVATFVGIVLPIWGMDQGTTSGIVTTLTAAGVLIGTLIGVSAKSGGDTDEEGREVDTMDGEDSKR